MVEITNISKYALAETNGRREFLKGMLGAGALVLSVSVLPERILAERNTRLIREPRTPMEKAALQAGVYLAIDTNGTAYVIAHRSEMGNGVRTTLPRILADELDADWNRV